MNRRNFQDLARLRAEEARALLFAGHYAGAYYLTGYVVECALKACIARTIRRYDFPDRRLVNDAYTHDLDRLSRLSGLRPQLDLDMQIDAQLRTNWSTTISWTEQSRYEQRSRTDAEELFQAVMDRRHGVLQWLRRYW